MAELKLELLSKTFGNGTRAVAEMSFDVAGREAVFLLGPSGAGKTTTLRMIAGLEMPSSGKIEIDGRNVTYLRPRYRNVGMVFQDYGLYRHMPVFENIAYPLRVRKMNAANIARKVGEVAKTLHIEDVLQRMPDQLSGGQLQRVAIARMLVREANVFLMDEPMSHLDAQLRAHMRTELKHLQKSIGTTTIFVTHDQLEAMTMADPIIVMRDGIVQQFATPQEIFERPSNLFVATFVGEPQLNVLDCEVKRHGKALVASGDGFVVPLEDTWLDSDKQAELMGKPLHLGVRPEHITICGKARADHGVAAAMFAFEATGAENLFTVKVGRTLVTARVPTQDSADVDDADGTVIHLRFDPGWLYLFDAATGATVAQARSAIPPNSGANG